ncbi:neuropeptides capa receptor-like [Coccinella septempunctata]|uniref:neuropeptides capa receptor-like n=1 Tax=Coccinella septempunctata TaxID=41139 RepID=UPI001D08DF60|nr:neuropeptides capa receptor-like [Coccinella septempunctata]XP_044749381.1 neuropeptides capa receptor-like [Coccinella septempunctata]
MGLLNDTSEVNPWLNETNLWLFIEEERGSQQQPLNTAVPLTVINGLIFITGITGNVGVCIVIRKNSMLHTATHYFLFNLAVADLILLIFGLPNDVALYWHQYPWILGVFFCKLRGLISEMASYVSVMTIVVFSTERYLAICHPLQMQTLAGLPRAVKTIVCLWLIGLLTALPFYFLMDVHYLTYPKNSTDAIVIKESAVCGMRNQPKNFPLIELSFAFFFILPLIIIFIQYIKMSSSIAQSEKPLDGMGGSVNEDRLRRRAQSNKSIVRMLLAVVLGFFCCWAPFHAQRLVIIHASDWEYIDEFNVWMFFATGIFYYFSSTLNPILYNVMSRKMRKAFKYTFRSMFSKQSEQRILRNSDLSSTTFHGRNSRSFREETQVIFGNGRLSVKRKNNIENDVRNGKRYDLIQMQNESIV